MAPESEDTPRPARGDHRHGEDSRADSQRATDDDRPTSDPRATDDDGPGGPGRATLTEESVRFFSGDAHCVGRLTLPAAGQPVPAVVLCTGFAGTQDTPALRAAARAFAGAGYGALTFDYRRFGASEGTPRQVIRLDDQLHDIAGALDFLRSHPRVDPERLVLWGTSLGGGHAVVAGSRSPDVAAVIAQVPFNGFPRSVEGRSVVTTARLVAMMVADRLRAALRRRPAYVPVVAGRNKLGVMASEDATSTIDSLDSATWRNEVAPRVLFEMMRYRPSEYAADLHAPLLVCVASLDAEAPESTVLEIVEKAPRARALVYRVKHFDVYRPEVREKILADQIAFLRDEL
jgi:dienelactone hydrolase